MKTLTIAAVLMTAAALVCAPAAQASVAPTEMSFQFSGQCSDCTGYGTGTLTVQDYTPGDALTDSNLVDFTYSSNLRSIEVNPQDDFLFVDTLSGSIGMAPGYYDVHIQSLLFGVVPFITFDSYTNGAWNVQHPSADYGVTGGVWNGSVSAAPEPAAWSLTILGVGAVGLAFRRAKRDLGRRLQTGVA